MMELIFKFMIFIRENAIEKTILFEESSTKSVVAT